MSSGKLGRLSNSLRLSTRSHLRYVGRCNRSAPPSTVSPAFTKISSMTPSAGAGISFSIFIASRTSRPAAALDFGAFFDEHARDAAGHERFDDAAVAEVVVAAFAAEGERIDDLDVEPRRADGDLVRRPFAVMRERELRAVFETQRSQSAGGDQIRDDPALAELHAIAAAVTLDFERDLFVAIAGDEVSIAPPHRLDAAGLPPARYGFFRQPHVLRSSKAMIAAAMSAASAWRRWPRDARDRAPAGCDR